MDPALLAAESAAGAELRRGVETLSDPKAKADPESAALAAWSLVHGFSTLWLNDSVVADIAAFGNALVGFNPDEDDPNLQPPQ